MSAVVRILDADSHDYDLFVVVPEEMSTERIVTLVDDAVTRIRTANPDTYNVRDLEEELSAVGLSVAEVTNATAAF